MEDKLTVRRDGEQAAVIVKEPIRGDEAVLAAFSSGLRIAFGVDLTITKANSTLETRNGRTAIKAIHGGHSYHFLPLKENDGSMNSFGIVREPAT